MTADKVTLRLNAVVTYEVADARQAVADGSNRRGADLEVTVEFVVGNVQDSPPSAVSRTDDVRQALYRETQLVLRSVVGARELDAFLTDKDAVATEIEENVRRRAGGSRGCPGSGNRLGRYPRRDPAGRPAGLDCRDRVICSSCIPFIERRQSCSPTATGI